MYSAAKSHVVSVLGPPPTRYAVHMTLELNRTASTAEQLNSLLTQIMENFSVSDHEGRSSTISHQSGWSPAIR